MTSIGSRLRSGWLTLISHTLNRLTVRVARSHHGPFTLVRTVGRKTGIARENPIITAPTDRGFIIELTYGPEVQWYRNVLAAGGCQLQRHGVIHDVVGFEPMTAEEGLAGFPIPQRWVLRLLKRRDFVRFVTG